MDILYSGKVNGFCLVTSDSDFTKLAIRLREAGMIVIGMGEQKTPNSLVSACETFKFLDLLYQRAWKNRRRTRSFLRLRQQKRQNRLRQSVPRTNAIRRKPRRQRQSPTRLKLRILRRICMASNTSLFILSTPFSLCCHDTISHGFRVLLPRKVQNFFL